MKVHQLVLLNQFATIKVHVQLTSVPSETAFPPDKSIETYHACLLSSSRGMVDQMWSIIHELLLCFPLYCLEYLDTASTQLSADAEIPSVAHSHWYFSYF